MLNIEYSFHAKRFLKKADKLLMLRIIKRIEKLSEEPFPSEIVRVEKYTKEKVFRIRVGDYRISYSVFHDKNLLFVVDIDKRERVY